MAFRAQRPRCSAVWDVVWADVRRVSVPVQPGDVVLPPPPAPALAPLPAAGRALGGALAKVKSPTEGAQTTGANLVMCNIPFYIHSIHFGLF